jgi:hypothetical protein
MARSDALTAAEVLRAYKRQPIIEKWFSQSKKWSRATRFNRRRPETFDFTTDPIRRSAAIDGYPT